jgi:hypothetical protein
MTDPMTDPVKSAGGACPLGEACPWLELAGRLADRLVDERYRRDETIGHILEERRQADRYLAHKKHERVLAALATRRAHAELPAELPATQAAGLLAPSLSQALAPSRPPVDFRTRAARRQHRRRRTLQRSA